MTSCLASVLALAISLSSGIAYAEIKLTSVTGASNYDLGTTTTSTPTTPGATPTTSTTNPKIFGGRAGAATCTAGGITTCDTCPTTKFNPPGIANSCNKAAILPTTDLTITFTTTKAGYPIITASDKTTLVKQGASSVAAGGEASITVKWSDICPRLTGSDASCTLVSPATATASLLLGVTKDNDNTLDDVDDEYTTVSFTIADVMTNNPAAGKSYAASDCGSSTTPSVCEYSIQSGDESAALKNLGKFGGFPTMTGINVTAIRVFITECVWSGGVALTEFDKLALDSGFVDLPVTTDTAGNPTLEQNKITGLANGHTYCTKIGLVDEAMNVGLFTPQGGDATCSVNYLKQNDGTDYAGSCHVARPDEVLGVLAENCFIATAAYGSPWAIKVQTFRDFRNKFLLSNKLGKKFVKFYYAHSPAFAKKIARSEMARAVTRAALSPIWLFARISLRIGILATLVLTAALLASPFALLSYRRKRKKGF